MPVYFFTENIRFVFKKKVLVKRLLKNMILSEGYVPADINVIFCTDDYLLEKNIQYLKKNYLTDIITFNYNYLRNISGDLFISIDRISENASINQVSFDEELTRVIVHGVLHLLGYNDSTREEISIIRAKEAFYLNSYLK